MAQSDSDRLITTNLHTTGDQNDMMKSSFPVEVCEPSIRNVKRDAMLNACPYRGGDLSTRAFGYGVPVNQAFPKFDRISRMSGN